MKKLVLMMVVLWSSVALAQNAPAFRQFYFNPFLFNPAFAGVHDYSQATILYRQQWVGFNDAPSAGGFTLQIPSSNRASFGFSVLSQEVVALQTSTAQTTFAYRVPISATQFLFFGISGVAGINNLKPDADYSNDPAILNATASSFYTDANFGLIYALGNLRVGFALPKLLGQKYFSPQDLVNTRYAQLRNQLYSVSYKFHAGDFSIEPYAMYRITRDLQNWWEGAAVVYYKEKIWLGTSYHSTLGTGFFLGFDVMEKLRVSYSYELPPVNKVFASVNSHEIQLQVRLGKKRDFKWAYKFEAGQAEADASMKPTAPVAQQFNNELTPVKKEAEKTDTNSIIIPLPAVSQEKKTDTEMVKPVDKEAMQLTPGYYVIAGSFNTSEEARVLQQKFIGQGYKNALTGYDAASAFYHVYLFSSPDPEECGKVVLQMRQKAATSKVWLLQIQ